MTLYRIDIQVIYPKRLPFSKSQLRTWAMLPLRTLPTAELTLRFVSNEESQTLNRTYRAKDKPTNVLAFPSQIPKSIKQSRRFLGDLVIASDVLFEEHKQLNTSLDAHWAHIILHGILHLLGYDHQNHLDTECMQSLEIQYLKQLNFPNPYLSECSHLD